MDSLKQPTKEQLRRYLTERHNAHCPPPAMEEIRRQLGWRLVELTQRHQSR